MPSVCLPSTLHKLIVIHFTAYTDQQLALIVRSKLATTTATTATTATTVSAASGSDEDDDYDHVVTTAMNGHMPRLLSNCRHPLTLASSMSVLLHRMRQSTSSLDTKITSEISISSSAKELTILATRLSGRTMYKLSESISDHVRYNSLPIASTYLVNAPTVIANDEGLV